MRLGEPKRGPRSRAGFDRGAPLTATDYDAQWSRLGDFAKYNPGARHRRRLILSLVADLPVHSTIDVGCGPGELIVSLADMRPDLGLHGVDLSPAVISANRQAMPFCQFEVMDLEKKDGDRVFDLVICSEVIEHLADWRIGVGNLAAMVGEGAYLILTCPTGSIHQTERDFGHVEHPTVEELVGVARGCGLEVVEVSNWGFPSYRALKYLTNVNPGWAIRSFGSGGYGAAQKAISTLAYWGSMLSWPDSPKGCQIIGLFRRS